MKDICVSILLLLVGIAPASAITITTPANGAQLTSPFSLVASTKLCESQKASAMGYSLDNGTTTLVSTSFSAAVVAGDGQHILHVKCWGANGARGDTSLSLTIIPAHLTAAAMPAFSLAAGTYTIAQSVTFSDATVGTTIYYTTNGTTPNTSSAIYSGTILVNATETIEAMALAAGHINSAIASAVYTITPATATPAFSVAAGTYTTAQSVALSDATAGSTIYYTTNGAAPTTSSTQYTGPISVGASEVIQAVAVASGYTNSGLARADYVIKASSGPSIPSYAISASELQIHPNWKYDHDPGTSGTATGSMNIVANPTLSGQAAEFSSSYLDWGGEIYHVSFGTDSTSTNFVYDAEVWIAEGSKVGNLEMDMNQVIPNGDTVIYGFQCDGDHGTWDYSGNKGTIGASKISWTHSPEPCNPADWAPNAWHHVQISYSRDEVGDVTYNSVWLDGAEAVIDATVPSAGSMSWAAGVLLTNFQVDGPGSGGASEIYVDNLTVSRW